MVVEAVGHNPDTLNDAVTAVAAQGFVYCFGVPDELVTGFRLHAFLRKNLRLGAGLTTDRRDALAAAGRYLAGHPGLPRDYVSEVVAASGAQQAFDSAARPRPDRRKVVLSMT